MSSLRAVVFAAIVVLGTVLAVPFAGAFALTDAPTIDAQDGGTNETGGNVTDGNATTDGNETDAPSVGAQISSFMQTSATNATDEVENGMFDAEFERADNKSAVVEKRATRIERQIEQLRERKRDLAEREGELNEVAYTARMSRIVSEIESLERQINGTAAKAERAGVDAERFDRMRANVSELRGPKVQAAADAIPGRGPPADRGPDARGPPDDRGGQPADAGADSNDRGNAPPGTGASDNASAGNGTNAGNDANASGDGGGSPGNDRGPSDDGGPGDGGPANSGRASENNAGGGPNTDDGPSDGGGPGENRPDVTLVR